MGTAERKQREFDDRQQRILSSAKDLFVQKGFAQVTLDDIADRIEFSKATLYSHFGSKEELYAHVLVELLDHLLQQLQSAAPAAAAGVDNVKSCLDTYLRFYFQHREYYPLLFFIDLFSDRFRLPKEVQRAIRYRKLQCLRVFQTAIQNAMEEGTIVTTFGSRRVATVLWGMGNGLLNLVESGQMAQKDLPDAFAMGFSIAMQGLQRKTM